MWLLALFACGSIIEWQPRTSAFEQPAACSRGLTSGWAQFFAESPLSGLKVTLTDVSLTAPALVGTQPNKLPLPAENMTDIYVPCALPQDAGNDGVFVVSLPAGTSDVLNAVLCSPGGYYQVCTPSCMLPTPASDAARSPLGLYCMLPADTCTSSGWLMACTPGVRSCAASCHEIMRMPRTALPELCTE